MDLRPLSLLAVLILALAVPVAAQPLDLAQPYLALWPEGKMPNTRGLILTDSLADERVYQVGTPGVYAFLAPDSLNTGTAVVICPGGGYARLAYQGGGVNMARWFNSLGVNAFVLLYRLPHSPDLVTPSLGPLQDAQRAMRLVRASAGRWGIDPDRVGIVGTSAGGHVASSLGTHAEDVAVVGDTLDAYGFQPDFMMLISPVVTMGSYAHRGSRRYLLGDAPTPEQVAAYSNERRVTAGTPPTFLMLAADDASVDPRNSLLFFEALLAHGVPAALHVFPSGGHAVGVRNGPGSAARWRELAAAWLEEMDFLPAPGE